MNESLQRLFALLLLLGLLPIFALLFLLCLLFNGGPVFYTEERLGLRKQPFRIWKFRTMTRSCADMRPQTKSPGDPRITAFGHFLRRFSLDELPQLWNVLKGEMALIGPRPITAQEEPLYGKYSAAIHAVLPGMTGLWQVSGRNLTTYSQRRTINYYYATHRSWALDLLILWKTIGAVLSGRGAF